MLDQQTPCCPRRHLVDIIEISVTLIHVFIAALLQLHHGYRAPRNNKLLISLLVLRKCHELCLRPDLIFVSVHEKDSLEACGACNNNVISFIRWRLSSEAVKRGRPNYWLPLKWHAIERQGNIRKDKRRRVGYYGGDVIYTGLWQNVRGQFSCRTRWGILKQTNTKI